MIRLRILWLFAALAVLALTTFASAGAVASTSAPNVAPLTGLPAGKFLVIGDVAHQAILDVHALQGPDLTHHTPKL